MRSVDVAIIGAGPCGSATCFGLQSVLGASATVEIFERAQKLRPVGAYLGLHQTNLINSLNALQDGLHDEIVQLADLRTRLIRYDNYGNFVKDVFASTSLQHPQPVAPWYVVQQFLLSKSRSGSLNLGHELETIQLGEEGVILTFTNGEKVFAKIVLGADGNYSKTRMELFDEKVPEYSGACAWRIQCPGIHPQCPPGSWNMYVGNGQLLSMQCYKNHVEDQENPYRTFVSGVAPWPEERLHELEHVRYQGPQKPAKDFTKSIERFASQFQEFTQDIVQWTCENADLDLSLEHAIYARTPGAPFGKGRVSLMGDAAHFMPPNFGTGLSMALEDSVEISNCIQELGLSTAALRKYEQRRTERIRPIQEASLHTQSSYYKKRESADPFTPTVDIYKYINDYRPQPIKRMQPTVTAFTRGYQFISKGSQVGKSYYEHSMYGKSSSVVFKRLYL
eukprot:TRINITY_DN34517_c0_g1_i1.p1 TRINITY_DN34517_c0_g1~~TRINITY_DN34517_c0_g1_i1.p1  ORF type:complete len:450 (-),score=23.20 TRINITY_DN34517_c0_g1_i1:485-1834(-)